MENINLHNYEAFFLDFLEGNLSTEQIAEMDAFLMSHPELKADLDEMTGLEELKLFSSENTFDGKAALKADPTILSMFTVDDWMIAAVENQLDHVQLEELNKFVSANGLEAKFEAYQKTVLVADEKEVFTSKSSLKRKGGLVIPLFYRYAAVAAAVILLIGISVFNGGSSEDPSNQIETIALSTPADYKTNFVSAIRSFENSTSPQDNDQNEIIPDVIPNQYPEFAIQDSIESLPVQKDPFINPQFVQLDRNDDTLSNDPHLFIKEEILPENDDMAAVVPTKSEKVLITEEPYKLFTNATGNFIKRPVVFTRDKEKESDDYVAYHFKIGRFEFDRKKSK